MLTNIESLAIAKFFKNESELAKQVSEGIYPLDFIVRWRGTLEKAPNSPMSPTVRTPWFTVMALLVQRLGIQREETLKIIFQCIRDATLLDKSAEKELLKITGVAAMRKRIEDEFDAMPKIPRNGVVTVTASVEKISM